MSSISTYAPLMIDALTLAMHYASDTNKHLITDIIGMYERQKSRLGSSGDVMEQIVNLHVSIIKDIFSGQLDVEDDKERKRYISKLRTSPLFKKEPESWKDLEEIFMDRDGMAPEKLEKIATTLRNQYTFEKLNQTARRTNAAIMQMRDRPDKQQDIQDTIDFIQESLDGLKDSLRAASTYNLPGLVERVSFQDKESLRKAAEKKSTRRRQGGYRTGLIGLNMMFGKGIERIGRGESVVFNALSHNYKSGILTSMAMWLPLYNKPTPLEMTNGFKPLILQISIENEAHMNSSWIAEKLYWQEQDKNPAEVDDLEVSQYAAQRLSESGYHVEILRYTPEDFGYAEFKSVVEAYENNGYIVCVTIVDYVNNMKKGTDNKASQAGNHLAVKEIYSNLCNYTKSKGITLITAHQLNRKAQELAKSGQMNIAKKLNAEHLADSMDVQREVDTSFYMHIEKDLEGKSWLTLYRDKRRYDDTTPEAHKYVAYPFDEVKGIIDDYSSGVPGFVRDIYSYNNGPNKANANKDIF